MDCPKCDAEMEAAIITSGDREIGLDWVCPKCGEVVGCEGPIYNDMI